MLHWFSFGTDFDANNNFTLSTNKSINSHELKLGVCCTYTQMNDFSQKVKHIKSQLLTGFEGYVL